MAALLHAGPGFCLTGRSRLASSTSVDTARWVAPEDERMRLAYHQCRWRGLTSADKVAARARQLGRRDPGAARFAGDLERRGVQILTVTARDVSDEDTFSRWVHAQLVVRAYDLALPIPTLRPGGAVSAP